MASIYLSAGTFKNSIKNAEDRAREILIQAKGMGNGYVGVEEFKMAATIILKAADEATKYIEKGSKAFNRQYK